MHRWIVADGRVLGAIALRHEFSDFVREAGHIGYGLGLDRVLIVCEAGNVASAMTIERHGGVLEEIRQTSHGPFRPYWITL